MSHRLCLCTMSTLFPSSLRCIQTRPPWAAIPSFPASSPLILSCVLNFYTNHLYLLKFLCVYSHFENHCLCFCQAFVMVSRHPASWLLALVFIFRPWFNLGFLHNILDFVCTNIYTSLQIHSTTYSLPVNNTLVLFRDFSCRVFLLCVWVVPLEFPYTWLIALLNSKKRDKG